MDNKKIQEVDDHFRKTQKNLDDTRKEDEEYLDICNKRLDELNNQYAVIAIKIEEFIKRNQQQQLSNYQEELNKLLQQRDSISDEAKSLRETIERQKNKIHFNRKYYLSRVENLLGIQITDQAGAYYDQNLKMLRIIPKDSLTLREEQGYINQQLDQLLEDGIINFSDHKQMKSEIRKEYDEMVKLAPRPVREHVKEDTGKKSHDSFNSQQQSTDFLIEEMRKKYQYDDMTEEEKEIFDSKLRKMLHPDLFDETVDEYVEDTDYVEGQGHHRIM